MLTFRPYRVLYSVMLAMACTAAGLSVSAQNPAPDSSNAFLKRIFLPSIDMGYQWTNSDLLEGSLKIATSVEYRIRNNNDAFIRLNYDTFSPRYTLNPVNGTGGTVSGTVQVTDINLGLGYRFGDRTFRLMLAGLPGYRLYDYPVALQNGQDVEITLRRGSLFTTTWLTTLEYYFDEKSAFTISLFQNQVWEGTDFWTDGRSAAGFSVGFITSLF